MRRKRPPFSRSKSEALQVGGGSGAQRQCGVPVVLRSSDKVPMPESGVHRSTRRGGVTMFTAGELRASGLCSPLGELRGKSSALPLGERRTATWRASLLLRVKGGLLRL